MYINRLSILIIGALLASGCGSNGSSGTEITKPPKKAVFSKKSRGYYYYKETPIEGVKFECGNISGYTYTNGEFTYEIGNGCTFSLNNIELKTLEPSKLSKDVKIKEDKEENVRFLLSLDNDGNADTNHIKITKSVREALGDIDEIPTDMSTLVNNIKNSVSDYNGVAKNKADILGLSDLKVRISHYGSKLFGENFTLEAKLSNNKDSIESVEWRDNSDILNERTQKIKKNDFTSGEHKIIIKATTKKGIELSSDYTFTITPIELELQKNSPENPTYDINEEVKITALIKGDLNSISSYSWKDGESEISTEQNLSQTFTKGEHKLKLTVIANNKLFSKEENIIVSDWTNFSDKDNIFTDSTTGLKWVSETDQNKKGACLAIHTRETYEEAKTFCENLTLLDGGWRIPTSDELKTLITTTIEANVLPGYLAPCPVLLAFDAGNDENSTTHIDGGFTSVITRYGDSTKAGEIKKLDITDDGMKIGLRCIK